MRYWTYTIKSVFLILISVFLVMCSGRMKPREREGNGGRYYGGVFNANEAEELRGLFPLSLTQAASHRVAAQIYEGLVGFDQGDLTVRPALATSWEVDPTGTIYTFHIRKGVRFHDNSCFPDGKGRELTAHDVAYCFTRICSASDMNQMRWLFQGRVLGADEHFEATREQRNMPGVKGIEAVDAHTVRITLTGASPGFLQVLAHQGCWIYPRELVDHHGEEAMWRPVGTGAFMVKTFRRGEALIMERNPGYWGTDEHGNQLPFLDAIRYTFANDKVRELEEFERGHLSVIYELPVDRTDILENADRKYQVQSIPSYSVQFYGFNTRRKPFDDRRVRRAFTLALNRQLLVDSVLNGLAVPALRGVVAPGFSGYPYDSIPVSHYDPDKARQLLAEAGYPGGKGLPTIYLQVNSDGFGYIKVAGLVQSMLEQELGARVISTVLPVKQHFEKIERGEASFWREGWIVDHPDPENILELFHGRNVPGDTSQPSYLNSTRYVDKQFDGWFALAQGTTDHKARMNLLARAEKKLMHDAVVLPLYHERSVRLLQPFVRDLPINGMEYRDLRTVWFDPTARTGN
jgi:oligopeptide transport system substrate-binding protein